jgi:hypothetical protein
MSKTIFSAAAAAFIASSLAPYARRHGVVVRHNATANIIAVIGHRMPVTWVYIPATLDEAKSTLNRAIRLGVEGRPADDVHADLAEIWAEIERLLPDFADDEAAALEASERADAEYDDWATGRWEATYAS